MTGFDWAAKIGALLERANHPNTPAEESASCRMMAERLMDKYRIAEETALATDPHAVSPIFKTIRVTTWTLDHFNPMMDEHYNRTMRYIAQHAGCRVVITWDNGNVATLCGYEGDIRYAEYLWTSALLVFSTRINPVWDASVSERENIWRMRNAGITRKIIANAAWGRGAGDIARNRSKVQRIYVEECVQRGENVRAAGLGHQADQFQESYAEAFYYELARRLRQSRDAADQVNGAVVHHGRAERVDETFYGRYPSMRPTPPSDAPTATSAPSNAPCERCTKAKSGHCRDHPSYQMTKAERRRHDARFHGTSARAGRDAGRDAASHVEIVRGGDRASRLAPNTTTDTRRELPYD